MKVLKVVIIVFTLFWLYLCIPKEKEPDPPVILEPYKGIWDPDGNRYITNAMRDTVFHYNGHWYNKSNLPYIRPYPEPKHKKHTLRWLRPPTGTNYPANFQPTPYELQQWRESQKLQEQINNQQ